MPSPSSFPRPAVSSPRQHAGGVLAVALALAGSALRASAAPRPVVAVRGAPPRLDRSRRAADEVEKIVVMLPLSAEAETYEPTPQQMRRALAACCALRRGRPSPLRGWRRAAFPLARARDRAGCARVVPGPRRSRRTAGCHLGHSEHPGHAAHDDDPHAWLPPPPPPLAACAAGGALPDLARALAGMLPAAAGTIGERERRLDAELAALDAELGTRLTAAAARRAAAASSSTIRRSASSPPTTAWCRSPSSTRGRDPSCRASWRGPQLEARAPAARRWCSRLAGRRVACRRGGGASSAVGWSRSTRWGGTGRRRCAP